MYRQQYYVDKTPIGEKLAHPYIKVGSAIQVHKNTEDCSASTAFKNYIESMSSVCSEKGQYMSMLKLQPIQMHIFDGIMDKKLLCMQTSVYIDDNKSYKITGRKPLRGDELKQSMYGVSGLDKIACIIKSYDFETTRNGNGVRLKDDSYCDVFLFDKNGLAAEIKMPANDIVASLKKDNEKDKFFTIRSKIFNVDEKHLNEYNKKFDRMTNTSKRELPIYNLNTDTKNDEIHFT